MQRTKEDRQWAKEEARLRGIYGGLKCKECGILIVSKYASECREKFNGKIPEILKPMPKHYGVTIKLMKHASRKEITRDPNFLNGKFLGLHLIRSGYCMSCDADESECIFYCKKGVDNS